MKTVSQAYKQSMQSAFRAQSEVKVVIQGIGGTKVFDTSIIKTLTINNEIDPLSRKLPTELVSFSIIDLEGRYNPYSPTTEWNDADKNASFTVQFGYYVNGSIEWLASDKYILSGRPTFDNGIASFSGHKKLYTLTEKYYKGVFPTTQISYYNLAYAVMTDAGLTSSEYYIDDYLRSYNTKAALPIDSHKNCLQLIAHATGCALYTDSNGVVTIKRINFMFMTPLDFKITRRDVMRSKEKITKLDPLYKAEAYQYSYDATGTSKEIVKNEGVQPTDSYHVEFEMAKSVTVYLNDVSATADIYASAADLSVPEPYESDVIVNGVPVSVGKRLISSYITSDSSGGTDTQDNPLVTEYSVASILWANTAEWLQRRTKSTFTYRGNPELQVLDCVQYENPFGTISNVIILKNNITFNGALSGEITLKDLSQADGEKLYDSLKTVVSDSTGEDITTSEASIVYADYTTQQMDTFITEVL